MSDHPCTIEILLGPGAGEDVAGALETYLIDELDELLGDVDGTDSQNGRRLVRVYVRDLLSGAIALRRLIRSSGLPADGIELTLTDEDGAFRTEPLDAA